MTETLTFTDVVLEDDPDSASAVLRSAVLQPEPLLLVDRAVEQGASWLVTTWDAPQEANLYRGQGPHRILPGTLACENAVQSGELLIFALRGPTTPEDGVPVLARMRRCRFKGMVRPGSTLRTRVELTQHAGPCYRVSSRTQVDGTTVLTAEFDFVATGAIAGAGFGHSG